jgi:hypothetical protein
MLHTGEKIRNMYKMDVGVPKQKRHLDSLRVRLRWVMILANSLHRNGAGGQAGVSCIHVAQHMNQRRVLVITTANLWVPHRWLILQ